MRSRTKIGIGVAAGALVLASSGVAVAADAGDSHDLSGPIADQARAAAAGAVPGGNAGKVESETNEGPNIAYSVAVTNADGTAVEVELDKSYHVLGTKTESQDKAR